MRLGQGADHSPDFPDIQVDLEQLFSVSREVFSGWSHSLDWLREEYGRRHEPAQVEKYIAAIETFEFRALPTKIRGKMFVKDEGYFKSFRMKPRVVMEVSNLQDVSLLAPAMNAVADFWHRQNTTYLPPIIWSSGLSNETLSAWHAKHASRFPRAIENDFNEFESRIIRELLLLEFSVYEALGLTPLRPFMDMQLKMVVTGPGFTFTRKAGRMSGLPNTSLGNTVVNSSSHLHILRQAGFEPGRDFCFIANGDDNVIFCTEEVFQWCSQNLVAAFAALSMKAELVLHADPRNANFCSARFGFSRDGSASLCPHPFRAMAKAGKCPAEGFAGTDTFVALFRDYSSTKNFWPLHVYSRWWLRRMGCDYGEAESIDYACPITPGELLSYLESHPPSADGSYRFRPDPRLYQCFDLEGLIEHPTKLPNFCRPHRLYGLPPNHSRPGWIRRARDIRAKLLAYWTGINSAPTLPRIALQQQDPFAITYRQGDAPANQ